jgi:archaemetzincin
MAFVPPGPEEWRRAIGSVSDLPPKLQRAFSPERDFEPVPQPDRLDWLSVVRERGQTFERFARAASRPDEIRHMYIQPLGNFSEEQSALPDQVRQFGSAFFARDVRLSAPLPVERRITTSRNRFTDVLQLKTRDVLRQLAEALPPDACCLLGVTAHDLYPHETWSFVFGEALVDDRVGVFSIARYDPRFYGKPADLALLLRRGCKVLAHEARHMPDMLHCVFFNCR